MLSTLLPEGHVTIVDSVMGWRDAIGVVCKPLIESGEISPSYQAAIVETTESLGPYYVLAPMIAMPHARPEQGVNNNALSLLVVRNGVEFHSKENDPVRLLLLLAAKNGDQHIELITKISEFFCNDEDVITVVEAKRKEDIMEVINRY